MIGISCSGAAWKAARQPLTPGGKIRSSAVIGERRSPLNATTPSDGGALRPDRGWSAGAAPRPPPGTTLVTGRREARLRREYAEVYAELPTGLWIAAAEVAEVIVRRAQAARALSIHQRTLDPRHFEFRGGPPTVRPANARTRRTDVPGGDPTR
jgi:hypothetical protein